MTEHTDNFPNLPALAALRQGLLDAAGRNAGSAQRRPGWRGALAAAGLCVAVAAGVIASASDDGTSRAQRTSAEDLVAARSGTGMVLDGESHLSFEGLVEKSDLVVVGTVEEVRTGREIVDIDQQYPTRVLDAVLGVDAVVKGSRSSPEVTVATLETAYAPMPGATPAETLEWRRRGEQIVAFIARAPGGAGEEFIPVSYNQSFYRVRGDRVVPLSGDAAGMPLSEFEAAVRAAAD